MFHRRSRSRLLFSGHSLTTTTTTCVRSGSIIHHNLRRPILLLLHVSHQHRGIIAQRLYNHLLAIVRDHSQFPAGQLLCYTSVALRKRILLRRRLHRRRLYLVLNLLRRGRGHLYWLLVDDSFHRGSLDGRTRDNSLSRVQQDALISHHNLLLSTRSARSRRRYNLLDHLSTRLLHQNLLLLASRRSSRTVGSYKNPLVRSPLVQNDFLARILRQQLLQTGCYNARLPRCTRSAVSRCLCCNKLRLRCLLQYIRRSRLQDLLDHRLCTLAGRRSWLSNEYLLALWRVHHCLNTGVRCEGKERRG